MWEIFLSFNFQGSDLGLCCCNLRLNEVQCSGVRSRCLGSMIQPNVHIYNHCLCSVLQSYSSSLCFTVYTTGLWAVLYCIVHYTILYTILYSTVLDCTTVLHGTVQSEVSEARWRASWESLLAGGVEAPTSCVCFDKKKEVVKRKQAAPSPEIVFSFNQKYFW